MLTRLRSLYATFVVFVRYLRAFKSDWEPPQMSYTEARAKLREKYLPLAIKLVEERKIPVSAVIAINLGYMPESEDVRFALANPDEAPILPKQRELGPTGGGIRWPGPTDHPVDTRGDYSNVPKTSSRYYEKSKFQRPDRERTKKGLDFSDPEFRLKAQIAHAQQLVELAQREYIGWALVQFFSKLKKLR